MCSDEARWREEQVLNGSPENRDVIMATAEQVMVAAFTQDASDLASLVVVVHGEANGARLVSTDGASTALAL